MKSVLRYVAANWSRLGVLALLAFVALQAARIYSRLCTLDNSLRYIRAEVSSIQTFATLIQSDVSSMEGNVSDIESDVGYIMWK